MQKAESKSKRPKAKRRQSKISEMLFAAFCLLKHREEMEDEV
jgi:hypothetical protein